MPQVLFGPYGVSVEVESGAAMLDGAPRAGVGIRPECSGKGTRAKCKVNAVRGDVESLPTPQDLLEGQQLACRTGVEEPPVEVFVAQESQQLTDEASVRG